MRIPSALTNALATADRMVHTGVSDDGDLLLDVLEPGPGRRFVCVSALGAGEAAMTLVGRGADPVLAYDIGDPTALHRLLTLKLTAAHLLGREDYLAIMGLRPASRLRRRALADQVLRGLDDADARWWQLRRGWLITGLFRADRVSAFFSTFLFAAKTMMPRNAYESMVFGKDPGSRVDAFRQHLAREGARRSLRFLGERVNLFFPKMEWDASEYPRALNRDPLGYLEQLVQSGLADNPLFAHLVRDRDVALPSPLLPPHLRPGEFDQLRAAKSKIRVVPVRKPDFASSPDQLDGAYLSNVIDYLDEPARAELFRTLEGRLGPGAPVLVYSNEAFDKVPESSGLILDLESSERAKTRDRAGIYRRIQVWRSPGRTPSRPRPKGSSIPSLRIVS